MWHGMFCALGLLLVAASLEAAVSAEAVPRLEGEVESAPPLQAQDPDTQTLRATEAAPPDLHAANDPSGLEMEVASLRARALSTEPEQAQTPRQQAAASWTLGLLYLHGTGVAYNPAEAARWFERAHTLGEPMAAAGLAWCEIEGCQGAPNPAAARRWILQLRGVDLPRSLYFQWLVTTRLAPLHAAAPDLRGEAPRSSPGDRRLLVGAAQGGNIHARLELGFESVAENRLYDALQHFRAAAPRSPAAAANAALLSERLHNVSDPRLLASARENFARAQRNHRGEGQPANFVEAIRLYRLAQSQGSGEARRMLELIFSRPGPDGQVDIQWMQQLAYVNVSKEGMALESATVRRSLRREPTAVSDLLPPHWHKLEPPGSR